MCCGEAKSNEYEDIRSPATKEGTLVFSSTRCCFQIQVEVIHHVVIKKKPPKSGHE